MPSAQQADFSTDIPAVPRVWHTWDDNHHGARTHTHFKSARVAQLEMLVAAAFVFLSVAIAKTRACSSRLKMPRCSAAKSNC